MTLHLYLLAKPASERYKQTNYIFIARTKCSLLSKINTHRTHVYFGEKQDIQTTTDRPRVMREDVLYIKKSSVIQVQSKGYWNSSRTLATIVLSKNREVLSLPFTFAHLPPRTQPSTPSLSALCAVCKRVGQKLHCIMKYLTKLPKYIAQEINIGVISHIWFLSSEIIR